MTLQVHYETVNKEEENFKEFDQYLSAPATRIFKIDGVVNGWENPNEDSLRRLTDRINDLNYKFIREKSGLQLSGINLLILKMSLYYPLKARSYKALIKFIANKKQIIYIKNTDYRCFGYALLYLSIDLIYGILIFIVLLYTQKKCFSKIILIIFHIQLNLRM
jgi:hypothetical protein